jgi:two-component system, cell cycle sensor histidine kinase and response regulator CckA
MLFPIFRRSYVPYLLAFLIFASAVAVRLAILGGLGTRVPYLTFFPAVMLAVLAGGLPAGSLVIILSALFTCFFSFEPIGHLAVRNNEDLIGLAVFLSSCAMVCAMSAVTRRAQKRASEAESRVKLAWEREQACAALYRSEAKFRDQLASVAATVPGVINSFRLRPDGSSCLPFASSALDQIYGLQPSEVAEDASALFALIHPDDRSQVQAGMAESARTLAHWQDEFRVNHPSRGEIWVEGHSVPQREPDGGTLWHGFLHDVTERKLSQEALRDSSEFCRQIISGAEEGIIVYGPDLRYQVWNPFMEQFTGRSASEVLGGQPLELFPFLEEAGVLDMLKKALLGEQSRIIEFTFFSPFKQRIRWVSHTFTALRSARGDIIGVIGIVRDITDVKEFEEELRGSEARFRTLVEQAADAFFVHGRDGRFLDVSRQACESLGYRREELLQMGIPDLDPYVDLEQAQRAWDLLEPGQHCTIQGYQRRKDGSIFPAEVRLGSYWQNGEPIYVGLVRDISERRQSEELVRESSRRLELATRSGKLGIWDLDVATGALHWNDRMFELYGIDPTTFDGTRGTWIDCLYPGDRDRVLAAGDAALDGTAEFDFEFRVVTSQGKVRSLKADAVVVRDPQGRPLRMIGLNRDITEQRSLEAQLHQAQKMEAVGRLAGGVAHDFNNNLTVILGYAELSMMVEVNSASFHDYLGEIIKAAEHSRDITQQLLAFSRNEIIAPRQVDLNHLILQTDKTLVRLIGEDVRLGLNTAEGLWPVLIDPAQVNQIIVNLAVNARDAMPLGGTLSIETRNLVIDELYCLSNPEARPGEYVQLTVSDTGVGMDREMQSHIFEPFFTTKEIGKGTGLGLATVYGIMRQNDGFIKVYSEPGQGAVFALFFPRLAQERDAEIVAARTVAAGEGVVLLVEDEATVRQMAQLMLEHAGYSVLVAPTPFEALEICRRPGRIDCLLTDVIMPGMNGVELSAAVQELRPGIGMVYMSGYTADMIAHHGVLARGVIFVQKPFDMNSLNGKVQEAMKSCQKTATRRGIDR